MTSADNDRTERNDQCSELQAFVRGADRNGPAAGDLKPVTRGARDYDWVKPDGGLWTSTWDPEYGSGWIDWCLAESFAGPSFNVWLLTPDPAARLYEVATLDDLERLVEQYPGETGRLGGTREYPSWTAVAEDYDGVHLTDDGQWATRMSHPVNLYGWDCECTLWFRWKFTGVRLHGAWHAPTAPCDEGETCWRCGGSGTHTLSRYDRTGVDAV